MKNLDRTLMKLALAGMFGTGVAGQALAAATSHPDGGPSQGTLAKASSGDDRSKAGEYIDDAWITAKVKTLLLKDEGMKGLDVGVATRQGTVRLAGRVNNATQIAEAEKIARSVKGVTQVDNALRIGN